MATCLALYRLHVRRRSRLVKCLQKAETCIHRHIGSNTAAAQVKATREKNGDERKEDGHKSYYVAQAERQEQAERSVLISCHSRTKETEFLKYLSRHGNINKHFYYESNGMYAVVEFANQDSVASLLDETAIPRFNQETVLPFKSRLLSLKNLKSDVPTKQQLSQCQPQATAPINTFIQRLSKKETIDQQITSLIEAYQLTDENIRLRFLVCSLLKDIAAPYFPKCTIELFGSSVNGFGKLGCDLDMTMDPHGISGRNVTMPKSSLWLEYQMKKANSERAATQSILSYIAECLEQFGPGCFGVQKILNARCPLVRFSHQPSGFQCDLTTSNRVATKSSELLYLYGALDPRVRSLVFTVRSWARAHKVTSSVSGAWITNFSLTIMVLFFLQNRTPPIIPTLDHLQSLAGPADKCVIEGNDCTFVSDFSKIQLYGNTERLEDLLYKFFDFYGSFQFDRKSIDIRTGREQTKPDTAHLHIQNPFETALNISKNVNNTQLNHFVSLCQESVWILQSGSNTPTSTKKTPAPWGLARLFLPLKATGSRGLKKSKPQATMRIKSLLESLKTL